MALPVSRLWDETTAFVRREAHLLSPLALATLGIGQALLEIAVQLLRQGVGLADLLPLLIPAALLVLGGQLSIIALVLMPGSSVAEALKRGFGALPRFVGSLALVIAVLVLLMMPLSIWLVSNGFDPTNINAKLPPMARLYTMLVMAFTVWIGLRLYLAGAYMVDRGEPMRSAMRASWDRTRGYAFPLLGVGSIFLLVGMVLQGATQLIVGSIFAAIAKMAGMPLLPLIMVALGVGMASAAVGLVSTVFSAMVYRHLGR